MRKGCSVCVVCLFAGFFCYFYVYFSFFFFYWFYSALIRLFCKQLPYKKHSFFALKLYVCLICWLVGLIVSCSRCNCSWFLPCLWERFAFLWHYSTFFEQRRTSWPTRLKPVGSWRFLHHCWKHTENQPGKRLQWNVIYPHCTFFFSLFHYNEAILKSNGSCWKWVIMTKVITADSWRNEGMRADGVIHLVNRLAL